MIESLLDRLQSIDVLPFIFSLLVVWTIVFVVEVLKRNGTIAGEVSRKSIHILVGIFIATTPLFMSRVEILALNLIFFIGLIPVAGFMHMVKALDDVKRWSLGQFVYPLGIAAAVIMTRSGAIFAFAVLVLALADGFAALIGKWYQGKRFMVPGGYKTYIGSYTFFVVTFTLFMNYLAFNSTLTLEHMLIVTFGALAVTAVEALIAGGFDNVFIPIASVAVLSLL